MTPLPDVPSLFNQLLNVVTALIGDVERGGVFSWVTQFFTLIKGNSYLTLFCIVLPLVGLGIGVIRRLVRIRA